MGTGSSLEARVRARLDEWRDAGLLRTLQAPAGIDLSSNDYLTLSTHPRVIERMAEAAVRDGCGSTGSRLLRGQRDAFSTLEARFARFKGTERSLYFSSGYLANIAVMTAMTERGDVIFSDERNHASVIDGIRLSSAARVVFPHNDAVALERLLLETPCRGHRLIVVESLFSMDGDLAPLREYAALCRSTGATLVVDEAHAVGIYGARGSGLVEAAGVDADVCLTVNTAGKALGVAGAFVNGPAWAIDYLIQRARPFVFSTAPPPALAAAIQASLDIVGDEPDRRGRLAARVRLLRTKLTTAGIIGADGTSQIIPVVIGDNDRAVAVAQTLQADGFDVRAIRPPSVPDGTARLRISVNAGLSEAVVERFADALVNAVREVGVCSAGSS
jgi:8-amino-7-oxononanoate synthase